MNAARTTDEYAGFMNWRIRVCVGAIEVEVEGESAAEVRSEVDHALRRYAGIGTTPGNLKAGEDLRLVINPAQQAQFAAAIETRPNDTDRTLLAAFAVESSGRNSWSRALIESALEHLNMPVERVDQAIRNLLARRDKPLILIKKGQHRLSPNGRASAERMIDPDPPLFHPGAET